MFKFKLELRGKQVFVSISNKKTKANKFGVTMTNDTQGVVVANNPSHATVLANAYVKRN